MSANLDVENYTPKYHAIGKEDIFKATVSTTQASLYQYPRLNGTLLNKDQLPQAFLTVEEERLHRKQRLTAGFRLFAYFGFNMGNAGHITVRDPEYPELFWVNPLGIHFSQIRVSDLILVDHEGDVVGGDGLLNRAAFAIHSALHTARPDVIAAAHSHSLYGKAFSAQGRLLDPLTQDACAFYDDHAIFDTFSGVVFDFNEGERIAKTLGHRKALILQNHGLLTVGTTVESAVWRYISMENAAQAQLISEAAGLTQLIPHEIALLTSKQVGTEQGNWREFSTLWDFIVRKEPDFLN